MKKRKKYLMLALGLFLTVTVIPVIVIIFDNDKKKKPIEPKKPAKPTKKPVIPIKPEPTKKPVESNEDALEWERQKALDRERLEQERKMALDRERKILNLEIKKAEEVFNQQKILKAGKVLDTFLPRKWTFSQYKVGKSASFEQKVEVIEEPILKWYWRTIRDKKQNIYSITLEHKKYEEDQTEYKYQLTQKKYWVLETKGFPSEGWEELEYDTWNFEKVFSNFATAYKYFRISKTRADYLYWKEKYDNWPSEVKEQFITENLELYRDRAKWSGFIDSDTKTITKFQNYLRDWEDYQKAPLERKLTGLYNISKNQIYWQMIKSINQQKWIKALTPEKIKVYIKKTKEGIAKYQEQIKNRWVKNWNETERKIKTLEKVENLEERVKIIDPEIEKNYYVAWYKYLVAQSVLDGEDKEVSFHYLDDEDAPPPEVSDEGDEDSSVVLDKEIFIKSGGMLNQLRSENPENPDSLLAKGIKWKDIYKEKTNKS